MAFVRIDGQLIHYRLDGPPDRPVLVFINSLGTDFRIWDGVAARLARRYRLLRYDMRGHGLSDAPAGDYRVEAHVADLAGLLTELAIEKAALIGLSVGGLVAQAFALMHPPRLAGLVLLDTAARLGSAEGWQARADAVRAGGMEAVSERVLDLWFGRLYREAHPDEVEGWRHMLERMSVEGYAGTCATLRDGDLREAIRAIRLKCLVAVGEFDASTPPAVVRDTADRLPEARFEIIEGAGHLPNIEQPAVVVALCERYFTEIGLG